MLKPIFRKKIEKSVKKIHDHPTCLSCNKKTGKFIKERWCFQCYYSNKSGKHYQTKMIDPMKCPEPGCTARVKLINDLQENDYCDFQEAECPECYQLYWLVILDNEKTLRIREDDDDDIEFPEQYLALCL